MQSSIILFQGSVTKSFGVKKKVGDAYWAYPRQKIEDTFVTFQDVMNKIIEALGGNEYQLGHGVKRTEEHKRQNRTLPFYIYITLAAAVWNNYDWMFMEEDNSEPETNKEQETNEEEETNQNID